jgi:hypothetical protein
MSEALRVGCVAIAALVTALVLAHSGCRGCLVYIEGDEIACPGGAR